VLAVLLAGLAACSGGNDRPAPPGPPQPSFTATGKPGGTLRVVGTGRTVPLDPALARNDAALLVDRLIWRQLYSFRPGDTRPTPDLAAGPPSFSEDRQTATITLRPARWNVPGGRNVTAGDLLRALKRLCAPQVLAPERSSLSEVVVGYADFCTRAGRARLGASGQPDLEKVDVPGLQAVGDTQVQIGLRRPVADLEQILALPATSPLPFEIKEGFDEPLQLVTDGPYRLVEPENGESYRLSRNASWDPVGDPVRAALVDRVTFLGGLPAADVEQRVRRGDADLSWDTETPSDVLSGPPPTSFGTVRLQARDQVVLALGAQGPAARVLAAGPARAAVVACLDRPALRAAFGGSTRTAVTDALLTPVGLGVDPSVTPAPSPSASASASATASASPARTGGAAGSPSGSRSGASSSPSASPSASPAVAPAPDRPLSTDQCRRRLSGAGLRTGADLVVLAADTPAERAAALVLQDRYKAAGLAVQLRVVPPERFSAVTRLAGWDLALFAQRPAWSGSRAVLGPLLDPRWTGPRTPGAARRSSTWLPALLDALAVPDAEDRASAELGLASRIVADGAFAVALSVDTVRTTGPNVGRIPPLASIGNADPTNVALDTTRPTETASPNPGPS
jgi:peptide/nickel transport system substrate-binding protein